MSKLYNCLRVLLTAISYFLLLEIIFKEYFYPDLPLIIEYTFWMVICLIIIFFVWLIATKNRVIWSVGFWLFIIIFSFWFNWHRREIGGLGIDKFFLALLPSILALLVFFLLTLFLYLEHYKNFAPYLLAGAIIALPFWLFVYNEGLIFKLGFSEGISALINLCTILISVLILAGLGFFLARFKLEKLTSFWLIFSLAVAIYVFSAPLISEFHKTSPKTLGEPLPDLFLISVDTLRADHLGIYGEKKIKTPSIDALARDSVVFENAISPSNWTVPAIASWLVGKLPRQHKAGKAKFIGKELVYTGLDKSFTSIAEALHQKGYFTCAFVDNPWLDPEHNFNQGFDYYFYYYPPALARDLIGLRFIRAGYNLLTKRQKLKGGSWLTQRAIAWLKKNSQKKPLFFWIHYFDPHLPYKKHPQYPVKLKASPAIERACLQATPEIIRSGYYNLSQSDKAYIHELYLGEVVFTDLLVGELVRALQELGRYRQSAVIFVSDHGEEFWEHNGFEHGHTFFQELVRVPLFIKLPENEKAGTYIKEPVSTAQIYATFLKLAGDEKVKGDLIKVIENPQKSPQYVISEFPLYFNLKGAIIDKKFNKLIIGEDGVEFYQLGTDPSELHSLPLAENQKILLEKFNLLSALPLAEPKAKPIKREQKRRLKSLGYIK